ncbi:MAG: glycosyl hydrolase [Nibricoccus sp.]
MALSLGLSLPFLRANTLSDNFARPPASARPWVYWTWLNSNVTRESITADLESMARVGLGGALLLDVDQGTPASQVKFFDDQWQALIQHAVREAKRLGLELNVNNGPGCGGSGGPWVMPEQGMQSVYQSEHYVKGGKRFQGTLAKPVDRPDYRDIAVLAFSEFPLPEKDRYKIPSLTMKALQWKMWIAYGGIQSAPPNALAPASAIIAQDRVIDLTAAMNADGQLTWDAPPGDWTVLRIGHAFNGSVVRSAAKDQSGPETDKLSKAATALHFNAFAQQLNALAGPDGKKTLVATHIDSWEGGGQNWTAGMREEFQKRRGYDPVPFLPVLTGRVIGSLQISERFLWDLRKTVSELMVENYVAEYARLARENGLRFTFESYTTTGSDLDAANHVEEPMAEFWTPTGQGADFYPTTKSMASAAHVNGRRIVASEAFTSSQNERWLWHPALLKSIGDDAFCQGINRLVIHRFAAQPFPKRAPGLQAGTSGLHYERTNTWWAYSRPWHDYLTRCQYLLRQGDAVADVLQLQSEEPLLRVQLSPLNGYDYDVCGTDTFAKLSFKNGRLSLPNGRSYRLLTLHHTGTMTLPTLKHLRDLVQAGAAILGEPPHATPGLTGYPQADTELQTIANELWGNEPITTTRTFGKGRVFRGIPAEKALELLAIPVDFEADKELRWTHRTVDSTEIYFVSNQNDSPTTALCAFRVAGKIPELWDAETGRIIASYPNAPAKPGQTRLSIPFAANGSWFVVFRPAPQGAPPPNLIGITLNKIPLYENGFSTRAAYPLNLVTGSVREAGPYVLTFSDGRKRKFKVPLLPPDTTIEGSWNLRFPAGSGAPAHVMLDELKSWTALAEPGARYFSGIASYTKTIDIPKGYLGKDQRLILDLGKVCVMAKVNLNGKPLGLLWKSPYQIDITNAAIAGPNELEVEVINLWPNRLIADELLPDDSERNPNGTLKSWPQWLLDNQPSPTGRQTFSSWRLWRSDDPLQPSGLLGPVTLHTSATLPIAAPAPEPASTLRSKAPGTR